MSNHLLCLLPFAIAEHSTFFFQGQRRWDFNFLGPNYAGAALAAVLSALVAYSAIKNLRTWGWVVTSGIAVPISFALGKTYSRGALVAFVAVAMYIGLKVAFLSKDRLLSAKGAWLAQLAACAVGITASGTLERVIVGIETGDRSVLNRAEVWVGCLKMLASQPFCGWGWGWSGVQYVNWFQPLTSVETYSGVVSTPLQLGVELGVLAMVAWGSVGVWFCIQLVRRLHIASASSAMQLCGAVSAAGGCAVWTANLFSTLGADMALNCLSASLLLGSVASSLLCDGVRDSVWTMLRAALWSTLFGAMIFTVGRVALAGDSLRVAARTPDRVEVYSTAVGSTRMLTIVVDDDVTGRISGRIFRQLASEHPEVRMSIRTFGNVGLLNAQGKAETILTGRAADSNTDAGMRVFVVEPRFTRGGCLSDHAMLVATPRTLAMDLCGVTLNPAFRIGSNLDTIAGWRELFAVVSSEGNQ